MDSLVKEGHVNSEGYVNVADRMGLSGVRGRKTSLSHQSRLGANIYTAFADYSTYHPFWVAQQFGYRGWY